LNRLPMGPHELILADAGYCSIAGIEYVWQHGADVLVRVNPQSFVAYSASGRRISVSVTRVTGLKHYPADVAVGGVFGYIIGQYIFHAHSRFFRAHYDQKAP
jgi:membrane-associated phospholipid phosphatase